MLILAIDLGKTKSLACWYQTADASHEFRTVPTRPADFHTLLLNRKIDRVGVIPPLRVLQLGSLLGQLGGPSVERSR
jgi:hypothetical protein